MNDLAKKRDASTILLYNNDKQILLQHREKERKISPNLWAMFGGGIELGETPEQALAREAFEELEWTVKNPKKLVTFELTPWGYETILHVYAEYCPDASKLVLHEGQNWGWFHENELESLDMSPWDREILRQAYATLFPQQST